MIKKTYLCPGALASYGFLRWFMYCDKNDLNCKNIVELLDDVRKITFLKSTFQKRV